MKAKPFSKGVFKVTKIENIHDFDQIVSNPTRFTADSLKLAHDWRKSSEGLEAVKARRVQRTEAKNKIVQGFNQSKDAVKHGFQEASIVVGDVIDSLGDKEFNETIDYVKRGGGAKDSINLLKGVGSIFSGVWDFFKA